MTIKEYKAIEQRLIIIAMRNDLRLMEKDYEEISDKEFLYNRLQMISSKCIPVLAEILGVPESEVMEHPDFETEGNKMIDQITF